MSELEGGGGEGVDREWMLEGRGARGGAFAGPLDAVKKKIGVYTVEDSESDDREKQGSEAQQVDREVTQRFEKEEEFSFVGLFV